MRQRLYQTVTQNIADDGTLSFEFPPVPQGLVWTGSITLFQGKLPPPAITNPGPLYRALWSLTRNNTPIMTYSGEAIVYDLQAVGQEVIRLAGRNMVPGAPVTATWTGYSDDADSAPILYPRIDGRENAYTQVYTNNNPGTALLVTPDSGYPIPVTDDSNPVPAAMKVATATLSGGSTTAVVVPFTTGGLRLWTVRLGLVAANSATTMTTGIPFEVKMQTSGLAGTVDVLDVQAVLLASDAQVIEASLDLHGFELAATDQLQISCGAFTGTSFRAKASAAYSS